MRKFEHVSGPPFKNHSSLMIRSTLVRLKERSVDLKSSLITRNCFISWGSLKIKAQRRLPLRRLRVTHGTQPPSSVSFAAMIWKCVSIVVGLPEGESSPKISLSQSCANICSKIAMISELLSVAHFLRLKEFSLSCFRVYFGAPHFVRMVGLDWEVWKT